MRYKPFNSTTHDRKDGKKFRGAQVWSIDRANMTLRVQLEPSVVGTR